MSRLETQDQPHREIGSDSVVCITDLRYGKNHGKNALGGITKICKEG